MTILIILEYIIYTYRNTGSTVLQSQATPTIIATSITMIIITVPGCSVAEEDTEFYALPPQFNDLLFCFRNILTKYTNKSVYTCKTYYV